MSTSVTVGHRLVANVSPPRITLSQAVGGFELASSIDGFSVPRTGEQPIMWLMPDLIHMCVGAGLRHLGTARPDSSLRVRTLNSPLRFNYDFRIALSAAQMGAIEDLRDGGDLPFRLMISGVGGNEAQPNERESFQLVLTLAVPRSDWIRQLRSAEAMDILLLEVPMPFIDPPPQMRAVVDMLRQAQSLFLEAHYSDCVTNCRKAIEQLGALQDRKTHWPSDALKRLANSRDMDKGERKEAIEAALFHFGSLATHDASTLFDRRDARLAMALVSALVAHGTS